METLKLTSVTRYTTKQDGTPLVTKLGKPYTSIRIKAEKYGDKFISGFGDQVNAAWAVGDEVEVEVEQKGEYLNFRMPKKEDKIDDKLEMILNKLVGISIALETIKANTTVKKPSSYPQESNETSFDEPADDVPF